MKKGLSNSVTAALIVFMGLSPRASGHLTDDALDVNGTVSIHTLPHYLVPFVLYRVSYLPCALFSCTLLPCTFLPCTFLLVHYLYPIIFYQVRYYLYLIAELVPCLTPYLVAMYLMTLHLFLQVPCYIWRRFLCCLVTMEAFPFVIRGCIRKGRDRALPPPMAAMNSLLVCGVFFFQWLRMQ